MRRAIITTAVALALAPAAQAAQRFAAPVPTGTADCTSEANACGYVTAVTAAGNSDEVILAPGDYGSEGSPIADAYVQSFNAIDVHGVAGQPRPRIFVSGVYTLALRNAGSTVRHLDIERVSTSAGVALWFLGTLAEDVVVRDDGGTGSAACALNGTPTLRNSVCHTSGTGASSILIHPTLGAPNAVTLRNVTAISYGPGSAAMWVAGGSAGASTATAVNSIFEGLVGIHTSGETGNEGTANTSHSQHQSDQQDPNSAINGDASDVFAYPTFADFPGGDFHQLAESSTVDKGIDDPANGTTDFDGQPRTAGAHTDIGADEYVPPAAPTQEPLTGQQPPPGQQPPTQLVVFAGLRFDASSARLAKKSVALLASCVAPPGDHCKGTLTLTMKRKHKRKPAKLGQAKFSLPAGAAPKVTVKLSRSALKTLRKSSLKVTATAVARSDAGLAKTTTKRITIKPAKRKRR